MIGCKIQPDTNTNLLVETLLAVVVVDVVASVVVVDVVVAVVALVIFDLSCNADGFVVVVVGIEVEVVTSDDNCVVVDGVVTKI